MEERNERGGRGWERGREGEEGVKEIRKSEERGGKERGRKRDRDTQQEGGEGKVREFHHFQEEEVSNDPVEDQEELGVSSAVPPPLRGPAHLRHLGDGGDAGEADQEANGGPVAGVVQVLPVGLLAGWLVLSH